MTPADDGDAGRTAVAALAATHAALGARMAESDGASMPRHYGDPAGEYGAARTGAVVVDRSERLLLRLHGRDPLKMIQGLVTADVAGAPEGRAVYAAVLTPKGKLVADVRVIRRPDGEVWLDGAGGARDGLLAHLKRYIPPLFARQDDRTETWGLLGVYGPAARAVVASALGGAPEAGAPEDSLLWLTPPAAGDAEVAMLATDYTGEPGYDVLAPAAALEGLWRALVSAGARPAGRGTLEVLRIEAGRPRWGAELTEETIPLEAGLGRAISETKGCYTGQEVIVRILHRGHVNWMLRGLRFGEAPAPAAGATLVRPDEEKVVGRVTSACASPRQGETIGLGYVRREVEPPATLAVADGGGAVTVVALPFERREAMHGQG